MRVRLPSVYRLDSIFHKYRVWQQMSDTDKVAALSCGNPCHYRLKCGHQCTNVCHVDGACSSVMDCVKREKVKCACGNLSNKFLCKIVGVEIFFWQSLT